MMNKRIYYKSNLIINLMIFLLYFLISTIIILSGISGSILNFISFPLTIAIVYLIIDTREHSRARKYILEYYPERWEHVKVHVIGPHIHVYKLEKTNVNNDPAISEIINELRQVSLFPIIIFIYFVYGVAITN